MENKELITKGKVLQDKNGVYNELNDCLAIAVSWYIRDNSQAVANASLICEAFNVFNETNLTPLEMKERIEELKEVLQKVAYRLDSEPMNVNSMQFELWKLCNDALK